MAAGRVLTEEWGCAPGIRFVCRTSGLQYKARDELTPVSVTGRILESPSSLGFAVGQPALSPTFVVHILLAEPRWEDFIPDAELRPVLSHGASCIARKLKQKPQEGRDSLASLP